MDPLASATADAEGRFEVEPGVQLHWQTFVPAGQRPGAAALPKVLIVMGSFATKVHFASTCRTIADGGYEVLLYDHRGVGRSGAPVLAPHTAALLAADALALADARWGVASRLHVYGASMGGMVAQELGARLAAARRLLSLGLAITCRGMKPLHGLLGPLLTPQFLRAVLQVWFGGSDRAALVRGLMRLVLSRNVRGMLHPSGESYEQVFFREWLARFDELWTLNDHAAGACHAHVVMHHWLSQAKLELLRDSGLPILCQVALRDHLVPTAMQLQLADELRARVVAFDTGHIGLLPWKEQYHAMLLEHLRAADALAAVADSEARSDHRRSTAVLTAHSVQQAVPTHAALLPDKPGLRRRAFSSDGGSSAASSRIGTVRSGELLLPDNSSSSSGDSGDSSSSDGGSASPGEPGLPVGPAPAFAALV